MTIRTILVSSSLVALAACTAAERSDEPRPVAAASTPAAPADTAAVDLGGGVTVRHLAGRLWLHVTVRNGIPSNGLIVETADGPVLIDTAWDDEQTGRLAAWASSRFGRPIRRAIATHSHGDRLGGIDTLRSLGVDVRALDLTRAQAAARGNPLPDVYLTAAERARADAAGFEVFYPGPGHAPDNVVVWFPAERVLFGGCFVKGADARDLGNVADANLGAWPASVEAVQRRYPSAALVIPGHGGVGGLDLLAHTRALIAAPRNGGG